jgi:hypothetical protein
MKFRKLFSSMILLTLLATAAMAQNPSRARTRPRSSLSRLSNNIQITPQAGTPVSGSGTVGLNVSGNVSKGGGSFKIDHPLDPENKYLYHSFVESPDMKNIYDGNITTDANGEAVVEMPDYFDALNRDLRYQLTVIGTFAQAIVGEKLKGNRFVIRTNAPNVEVRWQVTGIRQDAYANKHRIPVEVLKSEGERGFYLYPEAQGQPVERGVERVRNPQMTRPLGQQKSVKP